MTEIEVLNTIKLVAKQVFPGCNVILFGSRARRVYSKDSDYDILLIIKDTLTPSQKIPFRTQIRKELLKYRIMSDILIQSFDEIKIKRNLTGHLIKTIMLEGVEI